MGLVEKRGKMAKVLVHTPTFYNYILLLVLAYTTLSNRIRHKENQNKQNVTGVKNKQFYPNSNYYSPSPPNNKYQQNLHAEQTIVQSSTGNMPIHQLQIFTRRTVQEPKNNMMQGDTVSVVVDDKIEYEKISGFTKYREKISLQDGRRVTRKRENVLISKLQSYYTWESEPEESV